jgi:hypothetical protein
MELEARKREAFKVIKEKLSDMTRLIKKIHDFMPLNNSSKKNSDTVTIPSCPFLTSLNLEIISLKLINLTPSLQALPLLLVASKQANMTQKKKNVLKNLFP